MLLDNQQVEFTGENDSVIISEVLVSPNGMKNTEECTNCYNATDWNGDGEYGSFSDKFIELHNPSSSSIDLSSWRLSSAVNFTFPANTTIDAGGYLVIAEDPAVLQSTLGVTALGPFSGNHDSDGETIRLRDISDTIVDEVDYKVGFPWPVASDGSGASIELINPSLNNSLGSSWRASIPQSALPEKSLLDFSSTAGPGDPGKPRPRSQPPPGALPHLLKTPPGTTTPNFPSVTE